MTTIQRIAQVFGWIFVVIAIWGALLTGTSMNADLATADRLWGLFPVNFLHNLVHLGIGIWGILASRSHSGSRSFALFAGALYIALVVVGLFFPEGFGLVPLGDNDLWLHAILGVLLLAAGLTLAGGTSETVPPTETRTVVPPTTASSPEETATRPPAQPVEPAGPAEPMEPKPAEPEPAEPKPVEPAEPKPAEPKPVEPKPTGSEGAAEPAPPPPPPDEVVQERPPEPEGTGEPRRDEPRRDDEAGPDRIP